MDNQELLQCMQTLIQSVEGLKGDLHRVDQKISDMSVMIDVEIRRDIKLLSEGHENILERLPDPSRVESLETDVDALKMAVRSCTADIKSLKKAQ